MLTQATRDIVHNTVAQATAKLPAHRIPYLQPSTTQRYQAPKGKTINVPTPCQHKDGTPMQVCKIQRQKLLQIGYLNLQGMGNSGTEGIDGGKTDEIVHLMQEEKPTGNQARPQ